MKKHLLLGTGFFLIIATATLSYPYWGIEKISLVCTGDKNVYWDHPDPTTRKVWNKSSVVSQGFYFERHYFPQLAKIFDQPEWAVRFDNLWMKSNAKSDYRILGPASGKIDETQVRTISSMATNGKDPRNQCKSLWDTTWDLDRVTGKLNVSDHRCHGGYNIIFSVNSQCRITKKI